MVTEIHYAAIRKASPTAIHLLCDLHRSQAWERWLLKMLVMSIHMTKVMCSEMLKLYEVSENGGVFYYRLGVSKLNVNSFYLVCSSS